MAQERIVYEVDPTHPIDSKVVFCAMVQADDQGRFVFRDLVSGQESVDLVGVDGMAAIHEPVYGWVLDVVDGALPKTLRIPDRYVPWL